MTETNTNPLLARIQLPGETFTLPSTGLLYDDTVLDPSCKNGEVRVHPMTTIDEITIKSPDMLFSGDAVRQVFARCIPQVLKVDQLFARDVDFLLVCLRKVSYGPTMDIEYTHNCSKKAHTYSVDVNTFIKSTVRIDPTTVNSLYNVAMENGQKVVMRPIRFADFVRVMQLNDIDQSDLELLKKMTLESVLGVIASVDEITDPEMILQWLDSIPPGYLRKINDNIANTIAWGPDFTSPVKCKECQEVVNITAPLNPLAFFT